MSVLQINLSDGRTNFRPGETVSGTASWHADRPPARAELSLIWSTRGKGTQDVQNVQTITFSDPQSNDSRPFEVTLPVAPYSFSGQLISLLWTLELNLAPSGDCQSVEIILAPDGQEVMLPRLPSNQ